MKNFTKQIGIRVIFSLIFIQFTSQSSFAQDQKPQGSISQATNSETIIIKAPGIKSEEVFLKYKNFLLGIKGVLTLGHTLKNEYILIEIDKNKKQLIEVLQPLKDNGFYFEYLFDNPPEQKLQELFSNDPLIADNLTTD